MDPAATPDADQTAPNKASHFRPLPLLRPSIPDAEKRALRTQTRVPRDPRWTATHLMDQGHVEPSRVLGPIAIWIEAAVCQTLASAADSVRQRLRHGNDSYATQPSWVMR